MYLIICEEFIYEFSLAFLVLAMLFYDAMA